MHLVDGTTDASGIGLPLTVEIVEKLVEALQAVIPGTAVAQIRHLRPGKPHGRTRRGIAQATLDDHIVDFRDELTRTDGRNPRSTSSGFPRP
jgi:hypothetical protein